MRLLLWFVVLAGLILGSWIIWGEGWEESFTLDGAVAWLEGAGRWAWAAGIGLLVADVLLPVPGTVVMSALGYLYGPWIGGVLAATGSVAGGLFAYGLCRALGEVVVLKLLGKEDFEKGRKLFENGGGWAVAMSRVLPILSEAIACTAGLVRMPFRRFLVALLCGSVPIGFLFASIGTAGRSEPGWAVGFSLLVPAVLWGLARRVIKRSDIDEDPSGT